MFKPYALTLVGTGLFVVWWWLVMSGMDYQPGAPLYGLQTAGWFWLGSPFLMGMSLVATLPFSFVARKWNAKLGWGLLLASSVSMIVLTFNAALPRSRVESILHLELPTNTTLLRVNAGDSFNEGTHTRGVLTASPELWQQIVDENDLTGDLVRLDKWDDWIEREEEDTYGQVYNNDLLFCYYDEPEQHLYFYHRSSLPTP